MTSLVYQQNATCIYILVHGVYCMVKERNEAFEYTIGVIEK